MYPWTMAMLTFLVAEVTAATWVRISEQGDFFFHHPLQAADLAFNPPQPHQHGLLGSILYPPKVYRFRIKGSGFSVKRKTMPGTIQ